MFSFTNTPCPKLTRRQIMESRRHIIPWEKPLMLYYTIGMGLFFILCLFGQLLIKTPSIIATAEAESPEPIAVTHTENVWPKYTIRVGLEGARKPIPSITGLTTQERAKEWLEEVSLWYTLPTWIRLWEKYRIDYTLPICIAWADSHLGKALKSTNNIGNVGNNDRGDVKHFDTLEDGISAIFYTLRNYDDFFKWIKYPAWMKDSKELGYLSGEWRRRMGLPWCTEAKSSQKCYATSMWVWSTNVTNCMSAIHNTQIDENYTFRLK